MIESMKETMEENISMRKLPPLERKIMEQRKVRTDETTTEWAIKAETKDFGREHARTRTEPKSSKRNKQLKVVSIYDKNLPESNVNPD